MTRRLRWAGLALLPPLSNVAWVAGYEAFVAPGVQRGEAVSPVAWFAFAVILLGGLGATGALTERVLEVPVAALWAALVWRVMAAGLAAVHAPGFLKHGPDGAVLQYWTFGLAFDALLWALPIALGHAARRFLLRRR